MTQYKKPPEPIFKAQFLRNEKKVPTPNDTFSDSSRQDLSNDILFDILFEVDTLFVAEKLGPLKIGSAGGF